MKQGKKEIQFFDQNRFDNEKSKYAFDLSKLQLIRQLLNESGLNISGKDLESMYRAKFSDGSILEVARRRYQKTSDIIEKQYLGEKFIDRIESILSEATLNKSFLAGTFDFEITDKQIKETDQLNQIRERFTTYFTDEDLESYREREKVAKVMTEYLKQESARLNRPLGFNNLFYQNTENEIVAKKGFDPMIPWRL